MGITANLFAHARSADDRALVGEQTGFELSGSEWYSYPWIAVYRAHDEGAREAIADFMEKAVVNGFIGYARDESRNTLFAKMQENEFKVDELNEVCSCDCSSLVYSAVYSYFRTLYPEAPDRAPKTSEYDAWLTGTGNFTKYVGADYTGTHANLVRGDIVLAEGHVAVWI